MDDKAGLKTAIQKSCRDAVKSLGRDYKRLSWFYRNTLAHKPELHKAAA